MAYSGPTFWYCRDNGTIGWSAVGQWPSLTAVVAGQLVRQLATPTVGQERVFVCIVAGTTLVGEPAWTITKGAKTAEAAGPTWQECTGQPGVNGDTTNSVVWTISSTPALGLIIYVSGNSSLQICTTSGAGSGSLPSFSATAGVTTSDGSAVWTSLGLASGFGRWAAPFARVASAVTATWYATGNTALVGDDHSETQSSSMTIPVVASSYTVPSSIYSVDHTSSTPWTGAYLAGAKVTTTGNSNMTVTNSGNGAIFFNGITFSWGTGANANTFQPGSTGSHLRYDNCTFIKGSTTGSNVALNFANSSGRSFLNNCTWKPGSTTDQVRFAAEYVEWINTASWCDTSVATPTTPFILVGANVLTIFRGMDFSAFGAGKTLFQFFNNAAIAPIYMIGCKLAASVTIASGITASSSIVYLVNCDSTGAIARQEIHGYAGDLTTETTIVRTGGASDGVTPISWKIVTTANSSWPIPFEAFPRVKWNTVTGSNVTVTMYGIWGGGAVPNNDDIWMDVEYFGSASTPILTYQTITKANGLATNAALTSDASSWGGSTTAFKMVATLSTPQPALAGYITVRVKAAKVSTTFYIDPEIYLS